VRRTVVAPRVTFSMANAKTAGVWTAGDDERLAAFVKVGSGFEKWTIVRTEAGSLEPLDGDDSAPF
jgi:hypothetical protein